VINALVRNFLRGAVFVVPAAATVYVVYFIVVTIDGWIDFEPWFGRKLPGAGFVLTIALITLAGFLGANFATRWLFRALDRLLARLPLIKLLYTSLKDLIGAFVGEERRFHRPVLVSLGDGVDTAVLGFQTRDDLASFGIADHVAVYFPQSYNFAGNLLIVPRRRVTPLAVDSPAVMALIVSGGVAGDAVARRGGVVGPSVPSP
jgi:uncharacterized membrane protein